MLKTEKATYKIESVWSQKEWEAQMVEAPGPARL